MPPLWPVLRRWRATTIAISIHRQFTWSAPINSRNGRSPPHPIWWRRGLCWLTFTAGNTSMPKRRKCSAKLSGWTLRIRTPGTRFRGPWLMNNRRRLLLQGRYDEATKAFERGGELGDVSYTDFGEAQVYLAEGNYDTALARLLKGGEPKEAVNCYFLSATYAAKGDKEKALASLQKTFNLGYRDFAALDASPYFASLRSNPRFQQLIRSYRQ